MSKKSVDRLKLYERLRAEHKLFCMGKRPSVLKASCEYLENWLKGTPKTQKEIALRYGISVMALRNHYLKIAKLLNVQVDFEEATNESYYARNRAKRCSMTL